MRLEHHLVGGYVRYISPHIIIIKHEYVHCSFMCAFSAQNLIFLQNLNWLKIYDFLFLSLCGYFVIQITY